MQRTVKCICEEKEANLKNLPTSGITCIAHFFKIYFWYFFVCLFAKIFIGNLQKCIPFGFTRFCVFISQDIFNQFWNNSIFLSDISYIARLFLLGFLSNTMLVDITAILRMFCHVILVFLTNLSFCTVIHAIFLFCLCQECKVPG